MTAPFITPFRNVMGTPEALAYGAARALAHLKRPIRHTATVGTLWERLSDESTKKEEV